MKNMWDDDRGHWFRNDVKVVFRAISRRMRLNSNYANDL